MTTGIMLIFAILSVLALYVNGQEFLTPTAGSNVTLDNISPQTESPLLKKWFFLNSTRPQEEIFLTTIAESRNHSLQSYWNFSLGLTDNEELILYDVDEIQNGHYACISVFFAGHMELETWLIEVGEPVYSPVIYRTIERTTDGCIIGLQCDPDKRNFPVDDPHFKWSCSKNHSRVSSFTQQMVNYGESVNCTCELTLYEQTVTSDIATFCSPPKKKTGKMLTPHIETYFMLTEGACLALSYCAPNPRNKFMVNYTATWTCDYKYEPSKTILNILRFEESMACTCTLRGYGQTVSGRTFISCFERYVQPKNVIEIAPVPILDFDYAVYLKGQGTNVLKLAEISGNETDVVVWGFNVENFYMTVSGLPRNMGFYQLEATAKNVTVSSAYMIYSENMPANVLSQKGESPEENMNLPLAGIVASAIICCICIVVLVLSRKRKVKQPQSVELEPMNPYK